MKIYTVTQIFECDREPFNNAYKTAIEAIKAVEEDFKTIAKENEVEIDDDFEIKFEDYDGILESTNIDEIDVIYQICEMELV